ncbi:MAG: hypothetical protein Q4F72_10475 [Desulfovibrionaceae bacterium]|nr:hypothetical protein [Desulfovibrionaceae bacterium]
MQDRIRPVIGDFFREVREKDGYVDKTALIVEILARDPNNIFLLARPRGFGAGTPPQDSLQELP